MNTEKPKYLNHLIANWKRGAVYTQNYLSKLGYYHDLVKSYRRNGWLVSVGIGAFKLPKDKIDWLGGMYALQQQLHLAVHVGGRTALELKGYAHYGRLRRYTCFLFANRDTRLPSWFINYKWEMDILYKATSLFPQNLTDSFSSYMHKEMTIKISAPERACLEMLYHVPKHQGFDEAERIMEGLMGLRPQILQKLLEKCRQIKVKRLFLYLAEKLEMPWFESLQLHSIDIGSGKRVIEKNGKLNKKYLITVPRGSSNERNPFF